MTEEATARPTAFFSSKWLYNRKKPVTITFRIPHERKTGDVFMYYFIINPTSSSGGGQKIWDHTEEVLQTENIPYEAFLLSRDGEAAVLARKLSGRQEACTIVVIGGDGTINEVINGIRDFSKVTLGCIPSGSGNDFIRGMRLSSSPDDMIRIVLHPQKYQEINIGKVSAEGKTRRFTVSAGMGFDADVCYGVMHSRMKSLLNRFHAGHLIYTAVAVRQMLTMKRQPLRVVVDGSRLISCQKGYFTAIMNLPCEGGGFIFCPKAQPDDDLLDLCIVDRLPRLVALLCFPLAYFGKHTFIKGVQILQCRKVTIQNEEPLCVHVDGEHFGYFKKITVQPSVHKLTVITG